MREVDTPDTPQPHVALLGHLPYTIMVSHCGSGYSRYEELAVTRWRADGTRDNTGQFCYREGRQPRAQSGRRRISRSARRPTGTTRSLATDRVTFHRADGDIETRTEIAVVPEDSAEVRRVTVTNNGSEHSRDRADQLRRDRARAARRRPRPSGVRQPVRRDRVARVVHRDHGDPAARARPPSRRSGACTWSTRARSGRCGELRDRSRPLPRPRPVARATRSP